MEIVKSSSIKKIMEVNKAEQTSMKKMDGYDSDGSLWVEDMSDNE